MLKMWSTCTTKGCANKAYMFPFTVVVYNDQTVVAMTILCAVCYKKHVIEYGLESLDGKIVVSQDMIEQEVQLVHELDASLD